MSIITDALKKIQTERSDPNSPRSGTDQIKTRMAGEPEQPAWRRDVPAIVVLVIVVSLISVGAVFAFMTKRTSRELVPGKEKEGSPILKTAMPEGKQEKNAYSIEHLSRTEVAESIVVEESPKTSRKYPVLNGIMYSPTRPQAIINGQIVTEGETVHGFTVDKILTSIVRGRLGAEEFELKLK